MTATVREEQIPAEFLCWERVHDRRVQLGARVFRRYGSEFIPVEEFRR